MTSKDATYYVGQINLFSPCVAIAVNGELRILAGPLRRERTRNIERAEAIWKASRRAIAPGEDENHANHT